MIRVETISFQGYCCAVFRETGKPDEFLVDERGKPRRFVSATEALRAGRKALSSDAKEPVTSIETDADPHGIRAWRAQKEEAAEAEFRTVFGGAGSKILTRQGREIVVERRRR